MVKARAWVGLLGGLLCSLAVQAAEVKLRVEPDPPTANESFQLVFETEGAVDDEPDFSPLEHDFQILGRNQQTALELINGRHTRRIVWSLTVMPRHAAPLVVPPIAFGNLKTSPRQITVASPAATGADDGLVLEAEINTRTPYVQQEVEYTIRLWCRYEISNASLSEPSFTGDVLVKPVEEDRRYEANRDGKRYKVVERRFVLYPQASGPLTIKPAEVTAQVMKRGFSLFDTFAQSMSTRRVTSPGLALSVKPVPASFPGKHWLPARRLRLQAEWQPPNREAGAGEPLAQTLTLWADGLTAGQLPPLAVAPPPGWKAYPERPLTNDQQQNGSFQGVLAQKTALIANKPGRVELPPVEVPWWNTETDTLEIARVPAVILTATGAAPPEPAAPPAASPAASATSPASGAPRPPSGLTPAADHRWRWLAAVCALGWTATLVLMWRHRSRKVLPELARIPVPRTSGPAVEGACKQGDPEAISAALIAWAQQAWPAAGPRSLGAIAALVGEPLAAALGKLEAVRYANRPEPFAAGELLLAWRAAQHLISKEIPIQAPFLPQLYPRMAD